MILTRRNLIGTGAGGLLLGAGAVSLWPETGQAQQLTIDAVFNDPDAPVQGNPDGDVTLVKYFDYQCPFCKRMHPMLKDVVAEDGNVRLVMKDWPIFGAASIRASLLDRNDHQAVAIGFRGTPAFAIGTTLYTGAQPRKNLVDAIAKARAEA